MRTALTVSMLALAVSAFSETSDAQTFQRGGNGGNSVGQRSIGGSSGTSFSQRSFNQPSGQRFQQRSIQPPAPGNQAGTSVGNRSFRSVQPPSPGNSAGNGGNFANRSFRTVQPPSPGNGIGGGGNFANRSFRTVQPPAPSAISGGNLTNRSLQGVQPPVPSGGSTAGRTATGAAAIAAIGLAGTPRAVAGRSEPTADTATIGAPIEPAGSSASTTTTAAPDTVAPAGDLPPIEMLAQVGEPIMPLAQAPTQVLASAQTSSGIRFVSRTVQVENCNVPNHGSPRFWRSRY